jgi:hypothetical protein
MLIRRPLDLPGIESGGYASSQWRQPTTCFKWQHGTSRHVQQTRDLRHVRSAADHPGRQGAIRQVIDNLSNNAIKYSPDGGTVRSRRAARGEVRIAVSDTGPASHRKAVAAV